MPKTLSCHCFAKVNLYLEILNRRPDGYHNLWTIFQKINLYDTITAKIRTQDSAINLTTDKKITDLTEDNLIVRAAKKLQESHKISQGVDFTLEKRLPTGAGLGGGSSNAAATLNLLTELWQVPKNNLPSIATTLGADISFFLTETGTSIGEGIGEKLTPTQAPYPFYVLISTPNCFVSTADAYQNISIAKDKQYPDFWKKYQTEHLNPVFYSKCFNQFESHILKTHPEINNLYHQIQSRNPHKVLLSGSGASLFALFQKEKDAKQCLNEIYNNCRYATIAQFIS